MPRVSSLVLLAIAAVSFAIAGESPVTELPLVFIKTYKTGSSTVRCILNAKAIKEGWAAAIPIPFTRFVPWDLAKISHGSALLASTSLRGTPGREKFDLWTGHVMYDIPNILPYMRGSDRGYTMLTTFRDPVERFISAWDYFNIGTIEDLENFIEISHRTKARTVEISQEFGAQLNCVCKQFRVHSGSDAIERIANGSLRVLLLEKLNEGLILLSQELGWSPTDVLYFSKRVSERPDSHRPRSEALSSKHSEMLRELNDCDQQLYELARAKHAEKVAKYGDAAMRKDRERFEALLDRARRRCTADMSATLRVEWDAATDPAEVPCVALALRDTDYVHGTFLWRQHVARPDTPATFASYVELQHHLEAKNLLTEGGAVQFDVYVPNNNEDDDDGGDGGGSVDNIEIESGREQEALGNSCFSLLGLYNGDC